MSVSDRARPCCCPRDGSGPSRGPDRADDSVVGRAPAGDRRRDGEAMGAGDDTRAAPRPRSRSGRGESHWARRSPPRVHSASGLSLWALPERWASLPNLAGLKSEGGLPLLAASSVSEWIRLRSGVEPQYTFVGDYRSSPCAQQDFVTFDVRRYKMYVRAVL